MTSKAGCICIALAAVCVFTLTTAQGTTMSQTATQKSAAECELSEEDYSVFTAVLEALGNPEDPEEAWQGKEMLVVDLTGASTVEKGQWSGWGLRSKSTAAPSTETRSDYETKSKDACRLKAGWGDARLYKPLASEEMSGYFKIHGKHRDGWQEFYKNHPKAGGFWTFSRPGYNAAHDEALLYVTHSCGWLCGTGHLYLLAMEDGHWKVKNRLFLWIS